MPEQDFSEITKLSERYNKDPKSRIFVQLADAYRKNKMIDEAIEILNKGLEHHPQYPLAYLIIGKCYYDKRMFTQAKEYFEKTLTFAPDNIIALRMTAETCASLKDEKGQILAYKGLLSLDPFDAAAKEKLTQLESLQKGEQLYTVAMAEEYEKQGDNVNALSIYEQLLFTDPSDLVLQQKVEELKKKFSEEKEEVKEEKIKGLQVDTYYKPEDLEPAAKPEEPVQISPKKAPPPPEERKLEPEQKEEEILSLEDFLTEETIEKPVTETAEKIETLQPVQISEEPIDELTEKLDVLKPFEPEKSTTEKAETPQTIKAPEQPQAPEPVAKEEPISQPIEQGEPPQSIEIPEHSQAPEPIAKDEPISQPIEQGEPPQSIEIPEQPQVPEPVAKDEPIIEPVEKPEAPQPVEIPEYSQVPEPIAKEEPISQPVEKPAEEKPIPSPVEMEKPEEKKEEPSKPQEEDFQSFKDWLSGLLK
ncbi:hypothetical protein ES705_04578 [subsurface metagenome]